MQTLNEPYLTIAEAAQELRVGQSTIRRWIRQDILPAYRIGQRRIALKRGDLVKLVTPARSSAPPDDGDRARARDAIPALTPEERQRGLETIARLKQLHQELLAARGGKLFSPSWELINEARDERSRQLG